MKESSKIKMLYNRHDRSILLFVRLLIVLIFSGISATAFVFVEYSDKYSTAFNIEQIKILWLVLFIVYLFLIEGIEKVGSFLFRYRWLFGFLILFLLVINKYHCDSVTLYDRYVQPNCGNEYVEPLFGQGRGIRSDDWVVTTPSIICNEFSNTPYEANNEILRGNETSNAVFGANTSSILSIGSSINSILFGKVDVEYAYAFYWFFPIILCFLSSLEMGVILTKGDKFLSTLGAVLITFSSWFLWWSFPKQLTMAQMSIVLAYYFMKSDRFWKKCLYGIGFSVFFANFICALYPAWQVPIGYIALVIVIWLFGDNWKQIKSWKKEWIVVIIMFASVTIFVMHYFVIAEDYISAITQTTYPGERRDYGGMIIDRMFYGFFTPLIGYSNLPNPTMLSIVCSFFPIPLILLTIEVIKNKRKDILAIGFILVSAVLTLYCTVGLPKGFCDLILLSNSTTEKAVEILSVLQVYILLYFIKYFSGEYVVSRKTGWFLGIGYSCLSIYYSCNRVPNYMPMFYIVLMGMLFATVIFVIITKQHRKVLQWVFSGVILITLLQGVYIRPISKGLDAIYSKPVATEINEICEENTDDKWLAIGDSIFLSGYLVACGAPTINSTNMYPNMQLWEKLDPTGEYEDIYNRYSHVYVELTESKTYFELIKSDVIKLHLNYEDLKDAEVTYIFATEEMDTLDNTKINFDKIYEEDGSLIYRVNY